MQLISFDEGGAADIAAHGTYRYGLWRKWNLGREDELGRQCAFIMLNPSTANTSEDDPTLRRCIGFARSWGYQSLAVANLFAYRTTDPKMLREVDDPIGPRNDEALMEIAQGADLLVAAWGTGGAHLARGRQVLGILRQNKLAVHHLGLTKCGQPRHPLYLPANLRLRVWVAAQ